MICFHGLILTDVIDIDDKTPDSMLRGWFRTASKECCKETKTKVV